MNDSTTLNGPLLSISINDHGNVLAIMESRTLSIDLPQGKDESLRNNIIQVNDEFYKSDYWKNDTSHLVVRNAWWLPSANIGDTECILLLSSNNRWHIYQRKCVKYQWGSSGRRFSPDLKKFQEANNSFCFIDLFISQRISYDGKSDQSTHKMESATFKSDFSPWDKVVSIDSSNFPEDFCLGFFDNSMNSPKKRFFKKKRKIRKNLNIDEGTSRNEESILPNGKSRTATNSNSSANGAVIKQITKISSSGEKRLITYLLDGKDTEVEVEEHEEKVHCVCGATEEDSSADEEWVECDLCHTWQHVECVAYFPEVQDVFHCDNCLKKEKEVKPNQKFTKKGKKMGRPRKPKEPPCLTETVGKNNLQKSPVQQGSGGLKNEMFSDEANKLSSDSSEICSDGVKHVQVDDPVSDCSSNHGIAHVGSHINCPCGASESESGEEWVQCDTCDKWQHQDCVNYGSEDQQNYKCPSCKQIFLFFSHHCKPNLDLAVEQSATKSSKFRIPKIPKLREDEFEEVGRSNCQQQISICAPIQPIYIPKCFLMAFDQGMRHAVVGSNEPQVEDNNNSSPAQPSPKSIRPNGTSSDKLDPRAPDDESEVSTRNVIGSMVSCHAIQDVHFIFMLYNKALLILHSFDGTYQISAIHSFSKYEMSVMSVYSTEPGTHSVATVDCLSNDIVLLDFGFTECASESNESEDLHVLRYPSMSLVSTRTIPSEDGVFIEKLMWASQEKLVVFKQESMFCYDVLTLQLLWTMTHGLAFLSDSHLDSDMNIVLFDAYGEEIVIDIKNGEELSRCKSVMETNEQLVTTSISPSGLMKVQAKVMCQSALQFNSPVKLTFSPYVPLINIHSAKQHSYEFLFLQNISQKGQLTPDYEIATQPIAPGASCPICSSTVLVQTEEPLEVGCPQSHVLYQDPATGEVLDPFESVECSWCGAFNKRNTSDVCGKCKKVLIS